MCNKGTEKTKGSKKDFALIIFFFIIIFNGMSSTAVAAVDERERDGNKRQDISSSYICLDSSSVEIF